LALNSVKNCSQLNWARPRNRSCD